MATTGRDRFRDLLVDCLNELVDNAHYIPPEFLAETFSDYSSLEQAEFFNHLAKLVSEWETDHAQQWRWMRDSLTAQGRELLEVILKECRDR